MPEPHGIGSIHGTPIVFTSASLPPFLDDLNKWLFSRIATVLYHPSRPQVIDSSDIPPKKYTRITTLPLALRPPSVTSEEEYPSEAKYTKALKQHSTPAEDENTGEAESLKGFQQPTSPPHLPKFRFGQRLRNQPARLVKTAIDGASTSRYR